MYIGNIKITPRTVVWAERTLYYDQPEKILYGKRSMFLVTRAEEDFFYGCPLEKRTNDIPANVLSRKLYPLKYDSRVSTNIYKVYQEEVINPNTFKVSQGTFNHITRNIYKKIILGHSEGLKEYNDIFVSDYMREHIPQKDNIIVYAGKEVKDYSCYYIYDEDEISYSLLPLRRDDFNCYSLMDTNEVIMPKNIPYFDYYTRHNLTREQVDKRLFGTKIKTLTSK